MNNLLLQSTSHWSPENSWSDCHHSNLELSIKTLDPIKNVKNEYSAGAAANPSALGSEPSIFIVTVITADLLINKVEGY